MSENIQARIGMGIPASVSPVLADMEIRDLKTKLAAAEAHVDAMITELRMVYDAIVASGCGFEHQYKPVEKFSLILPEETKP